MSHKRIKAYMRAIRRICRDPAVSAYAPTRLTAATCSARGIYREARSAGFSSHAVDMALRALLLLAAAASLVAADAGPGEGASGAMLGDVGPLRRLGLCAAVDHIPTKRP